MCWNTDTKLLEINEFDANFSTFTFCTHETKNHKERMKSPKKCIKNYLKQFGSYRNDSSPHGLRWMLCRSFWPKVCSVKRYWCPMIPNLMITSGTFPNFLNIHQGFCRPKTLSDISFQSSTSFLNWRREARLLMLPIGIQNSVKWIFLC